ncbi:hypothetical protein [Rhodomicrobium vannielii]|uniref:hypothetical protein n=1 Tax=Rhodomicrobium vannielii TaxID=1069 RepID=UPI0012DD96CE|nr:hypothetical protein [Rhodomicrobium vannielii]
MPIGHDALVEAALQIEAPETSLPAPAGWTEPYDSELGDIVHEIENADLEETLSDIDSSANLYDKTAFRMGGRLLRVKREGWFAPYSSFNEWLEKGKGIRRARAY